MRVWCSLPGELRLRERVILVASPVIALSPAVLPMQPGGTSNTPGVQCGLRRSVDSLPLNPIRGQANAFTPVVSVERPPRTAGDWGAPRMRNALLT